MKILSDLYKVTEQRQWKLMLDIFLELRVIFSVILIRMKQEAGDVAESEGEKECVCVCVSLSRAGVQDV